MKKLSIFAASSALFFAACCGDETTNITEVSESTGMDIVAKGEKIPACDKENAGKMLFVTDSSAVYYCANEKWATLNGKDGANGEDGETVNGKDGTSCTAREVDEGIEVSCGDKVVGTIKNGEDGKDGEDLISESGSVSFFIDSRDGKQYKAVTIGTQTWMAENLNYADEVATPNLKDNNWCNPNVENYCQEYGRLYSWTAAMDLPSDYLAQSAMEAGLIEVPHRGICPEGWHVPSKEEFNELRNYIYEKEKTALIASSLMSSEGWKEGGVIGNDKYGFNAKASGLYTVESDNFTQVTINAAWWSIIETSNLKAYRMALSYDSNGVIDSDMSKTSSRSVRCLKD